MKLAIGAAVLSGIGLVGCGSNESLDVGSGFLMLEYDIGPPPQFERSYEEWFIGNLQLATTESVEPEKRAAIHGDYGSKGLVDVGECLSLGDKLQADYLDWIDVGDTVTLTSGDKQINFHRGYDKFGKQVYEPEAIFGEFIDPVLAAVGSSYDISFSGSDRVEAQTLPVTLNMPAQIAGATVDALLARPGLKLIRGQDFELTWVPQDGVERVFVRFHTREGAPVTVCIVPDTGSYVLPASVISGHADVGNLAIGYLHETATEIDGREFQMLGSTCAFGPYTIE